MSVRALALSVLMPGFTGTAVPSWLRDRASEGLGGVCLFGHNAVDAQQVRTLTDDLHRLNPNLLVTSDEEGGSVTRLDAATGSRWPGHASLGALDDEQATYDVGAGLGAQARAAGVDVVLAPVVDVNSEPDNPVIGIRSFGATPELVARHGAALVRGVQSAGVHACAKHFPGHGATRTDSHVDLPVVDADEATWRGRDLAPFRAVVDADVHCVMTAHVVVSAVDREPATMSAKLLRMLRDELGFGGAIFTDAVDMRAISDRVGRAAGAVRALAAGVDMVCIGNPAFPDPYDEEAAVEEVVAAVEKAVADGTLPVARLEEASRRVAALALPVAHGRPVVDGDQRAAGAAVAARALRVRGEVRVDGPAVVLVPRPEIGYAAGRVPSALACELGERRPDWDVTEVDGPDQALAALRDGYGAVLVVEGPHGAAQTRTVGAVLDAAPDAVVVYGRLPRDDDPGERTIHSYGTGAAAAVAVADLLTGGTR
jgi:beta-N-acetylhexosaminidase